MLRHRHLAVPFALLVQLAVPSFVSAWGFAGHQAIGLAAETHLTPKAKAALARILQATDTLSPGILAAVSTWPDELRAHARKDTPDSWGAVEIEEAEVFNAAHPNNGAWHFVGLPLGSGAYPATDPGPGNPLRPFIHRNDIVHAIRRCIAILETPAPSENFSKRQAVRWLVHLIGDLHQPLHVSSGYYDTTVPSFKNTPTRIDDPVKAVKRGVLSDRGGNGLRFPGSAGGNLHSTWDGCLAAAVAGSPSCSTSYTVLAKRLNTAATPNAIAAATTPGDHRTWATIWATESLRVAVDNRIFPTSLRQGGVKDDDHGGEDSVLAQINAPIKNAYIANQVAAARTQLVRASIRLAALLNAIQWQ